MIVSIPFTDGEHTGCKKAPASILEQLKTIWSNSDFRKIELPQVKESGIENIPKAKIYLGGDHTITYHTVKKLAKDHPNMGFIVFDAHPDVYQAFDKPSHQDYLKFLIEEGILNPSNIICIGIRAAHPTEVEYFEKKGIRYYKSSDLNIEEITDSIMEFLNNLDHFYLSIDIDAIDPSFAPGVSYVEPNGLTVRELMYVIKRLRNLKNMLAMDVVEVNPDNDLNNMTTKLAAKILAEFL